MKNLFLISVFSFSVSLTSAQTVKETEVPSPVKTIFNKQYPNTKVDKWEKEDGNFEAEFKQNKKEVSVVISPDGKIMETETKIENSALPKAAADYIAKNMASKKIKEVSKITFADKSINYEADLGDMDFIFDAKGNFIKKEVDTEKD
jgi:hypothetical protein